MSDFFGFHLNVVRMKLAFSTLGCPDWDLARITKTARRLGYQGIELRALKGRLDLVNLPEFAPEQIEGTRAYVEKSGLSICCVDTSCSFHSTDRAERLAQVDLAVAYAELATQLGAPLIRIFPDKIQPGAEPEETRGWIAECLRQTAERLPVGVQVALETHGDFASAEASVEIAVLANHPNVKVIWDVANSIAAGDTIDHAGRMLQPYLAHIHLRDARPIAGSEHWLPVLAGRGCVSFAETLAVIKELNYDGFLSFEWEKYWHPEIEEPDVALEDFIVAICNLVDQRDTTECSGVGK